MLLLDTYMAEYKYHLIIIVSYIKSDNTKTYFLKDLQTVTVEILSS